MTFTGRQHTIAALERWDVGKNGITGEKFRKMPATPGLVHAVQVWDRPLGEAFITRPLLAACGQTVKTLLQEDFETTDRPFVCEKCSAAVEAGLPIRRRFGDPPERGASVTHDKYEGRTVWWAICAECAGPAGPDREDRQKAQVDAAEHNRLRHPHLKR